MRNRPRSTVLGQLVKFALVGGVGFVVDVSIFTALELTVLSPVRLHEGPLIAKVISTTAAIAANWIGNRYWTFGPHRGTRSTMEAVEFLAVSLLGMLVALACLFVSHYLLGFTSALADNLSSNVLGLVLGSILRFALYRSWVYRPGRRTRAAAPAAVAARTPVTD